MADEQPRWPRGTPVAPGGRGPGGGRFRSSLHWRALPSSITPGYPADPHSAADQIESATDAFNGLGRWWFRGGDGEHATDEHARQAAMGYGAPGMLLVAARFDQDLPEHPTASGVVAHEPAQARIEEMYLHEDGQWRRLDVPTGLTAWTKQPADWAQQISDRMSGGDHWPQGVTAENIGDALRARHPDLDLSVYASAGGYLVLQMIRTPRALRGQGKARAAMADLVAVADHLGMRIGLTAEPPAGERTSITRLRQFYRSFGFVPNTGRGRDPEIWEAMRRDPR